jgi:hypothetical protein
MVTINITYNYVILKLIELFINYIMHIKQNISSLRVLIVLLNLRIICYRGSIRSTKGQWDEEKERAH